MKIGDTLDLEENELKTLGLLASFHDIGKVTIPKEILLKPGVLTEKEWKLMQQHVERGHRIADAIDKPGDLTEAILYHHEWWDGSGYPDGLTGEEIPFLARIFSLADAYDAMLHYRSYHDKSKNQQDAIAELKKGAGSQFDPELLKVFLDVVIDED
jgi:HD-GYP domain-containing protein (c-di-GMP phosphodiesterase class II)